MSENKKWDAGGSAAIEIPVPENQLRAYLATLRIARGCSEHAFNRCPITPKRSRFEPKPELKQVSYEASTRW